MRVLVVDDAEVSATTTVHVLERGGHQAAWVGSAAAARLEVAAFAPDAVILDRVLPDEDGLSLARQLRAGNAALRIVMLSGQVPSDSERAEVDAYLLKPVGVRAILDALG